MSPQEIAQQRLLNQHIEGQKFDRPEEVVKWMGVLQAQDYAQGLWAIGLRMKAPTIAAVEQAIAEAKIVRTWPMRGTIHFVSAQDAKWMLKLSAPRMIAADARRQRQLGLDEDILEHCRQLLYEALNGGRRLSRPDLLRLLEVAGIATHGGRGYHILWFLSQSAHICPGPMQGKQQTFVLFDEWVPRSQTLTREEALAKLARRYQASHGPATVYDFAWWTGLLVSDARAALEAAGPHLDTANPSGRSPIKSGVHLLPAFDEYLLGYKDRSAVLDTTHAAKVVPGGNGMFFPIIVADGQVVGTWKRIIKKASVIITLNPFGEFDSSSPQVAQAAKQYGDFLGLPYSISPGV